MTSSDDDLRFKYGKERFSRFVSILNIATEYGRIAIDRAIFVNSGALLFYAALSEKIGAKDLTLSILAMFFFGLGIIFGAFSSFMAYKNLNYIIEAYDKEIDMIIKSSNRDQCLNSKAPEHMQMSMLLAAKKFDEEAEKIYEHITELGKTIDKTLYTAIASAMGAYALFAAGIIMIALNINTSQ